MCGYLHKCCPLVLFTLLLLRGLAVSPGAEPKKSAEELVRQALKFELARDNEQRQATLTLASKSFPDYAPARWHAGFIQTDEKWLAVEYAEQRTAADGHVFEYRKLREQYAGSLAGQETLARWCRKNKLEGLEKLHWTLVLQANPSHREARSRLAVREYQGRLFTKEEIDRLELQRQKRDEEHKYWQARLKELVKAIEGGDPAESAKASEQFQLIDDDAALPAVEQVVSETKTDLKREYLSALGNMKGQAATDRLVSIAVLSDDEAIRAAAVEQLRSRPLFAFVPQLLGSLEAPVELTYYVNTFTDGVQYGYEATQERSDGTYVKSRSYASPLAIAAVSRRRGTVSLIEPRLLVPGFARFGSRELATVRDAVAESNRRAASMNERILGVLVQTTNQQLRGDPQAWWQWWSEYNELSPARQKTIRDNRAFGGKFYVAVVCSCFLRGTQVWTDTGAVPIEAVRIGDRVLSQSQETGELTYKLVLDTTVRPPSPTLRLGVGDEEIVATLGHPIWVAGKGWRMTKELEAGDLLHGVHGSVPIDYIQPGPEAEAYNLVVADFDTYFIGKQRVLVHDNRARSVTEVVLPGFVVEAK